MLGLHVSWLELVQSLKTFEFVRGVWVPELNCCNSSFERYYTGKRTIETVLAMPINHRNGELVKSYDYAPSKSRLITRVRLIDGEGKTWG